MVSVDLHKLDVVLLHEVDHHDLYVCVEQDEVGNHRVGLHVPDQLTSGVGLKLEAMGLYLSFFLSIDSDTCWMLAPFVDVSSSNESLWYAGAVFNNFDVSTDRPDRSLNAAKCLSINTLQQSSLSCRLMKMRP